MTERTLRRYLSGERTPDFELRNQIFAMCGAKPATSILSAELGYDWMIGSGWQNFFDELFPALYDQAKASQEDGLAPIGQRFAAGQTRIFVALWNAIHEKQQTFLDRITLDAIVTPPRGADGRR